jgi:transposase InsO family protein
MKQANEHGSFRKNLVIWQSGLDMAKSTLAGAVLNPTRVHLSKDAEKRLRWVYVLEYECGNNVSRAARKIGISREWLGKVHTKFRKAQRDPRSLEPDSRSPHARTKRKRIPESTEDLIVRTRKKYPAWGKEKIVRILARDHGTPTSATTVGRYLRKHRLTDAKLAEKNRRAARMRMLRGEGFSTRETPPHGLADAAPGSLIAKDMKYIPKPNQNPVFNPLLKDKRDALFWYQHTMIDSCTRFRSRSFAESCDAATARHAFEEASAFFPFGIAAVTNDNGSENAGVFKTKLVGAGILQFWSRPGIPTDNPRVERSHRSDDDEFYVHNPEARRDFPTLKASGLAWDKTWNEVRPHQALGYLTPTEFVTLWKKDLPSAQHVLVKWNTYLAKQSLRLRATRKEQKTHKVQALNAHLEATLGQGFTPLKV